MLSAPGRSFDDQLLRPCRGQTSSAVNAASSLPSVGLSPKVSKGFGNDRPHFLRRHLGYPMLKGCGVKVVGELDLWKLDSGDPPVGSKVQRVEECFRGIGDLALLLLGPPAKQVRRNVVNSEGADRCPHLACPGKGCHENTVGYYEPGQSSPRCPEVVEDRLAIRRNLMFERPARPYPTNVELL